MPAELRPTNKRKGAIVKPVKAKRIKAIPKEVVDQKFNILEQKEKENPEGDDKSLKADNESDEEIENVSSGSFCVIRLFNWLLGFRMMMRKTLRWTMKTITVTTISTTVKATMMKTTISMRAMVLFISRSSN